MQALSKEYSAAAKEISKVIQESEELKVYLESEEEEDFLALREAYEPAMQQLHMNVAAIQPLELVALEKAFLDTDFEGLFLPKLLGYSVLRGEINKETMKYVLPQDHFKAILYTICNSSNFDYLKKRIGQSIQMGFAFSSDIWVTNLINGIDNRRIRYFLQSQKLDKYRDIRSRHTGIVRFKKQFKNDNFYSVDFPNTANELTVLYSTLKSFLIIRTERKTMDNSAIISEMEKLISNPAFQGTKEHTNLMGIYANLYKLKKSETATLASVFNKERVNNPNFKDNYFDFLLAAFNEGLEIDMKADARVSILIDNKIEDDVKSYYRLMDEIHGKGYVHQDAIEAVRVFYSQHKGVSVINECVRKVIYSYFARLINNLETNEYTELFELAKIFPVYMGIFSNEQFNQDVKALCMTYIRKLLKKYTDKRGKDYQDIKKFVSATFLDLNFLKKKEIVELFKTRRKRKVTKE